MNEGDCQWKYKGGGRPKRRWLDNVRGDIREKMVGQCEG